MERKLRRVVTCAVTLFVGAGSIDFWRAYVVNPHRRRPDTPSLRDIMLRSPGNLDGRPPHPLVLALECGTDRRYSTSVGRNCGGSQGGHRRRRIVSHSLRLVWLGLGLLPYIGAVAVDAWMHETDRKVPGFEQALHWTEAIALLGFLYAVFSGRNALALGILLPLAVLIAWDELKFHGELATSERRVHLISYAGLLIFISVWWSVGMGA